MNLILKNEIKNDIKKADKLLFKIVKPKSKLIKDVYKQVMMDGKRLRPLITYYTALSLGCEDEKSAMEIGGIIELIHTASLLHDDILDNASMRRGRPSSNYVFGNNAAVLCGDYLYSLGFNMVLMFDKRIAKVISQAAYLLAEGETQEIENAFNIELTQEEYFDIIYKKTAVLIQASSVSGALLANDLFEDKFSKFGEYLGLAFQIKDDCLDYESNNEALGKDAGCDLKEGKITLPLLIAMEKDKNIYNDVKNYFNNSRDDMLLDTIKDKVRRLGLEDAQRKSEFFSKQSKQAIADIHDSKYKDYLMAICDYAISRER